MSRCRRCRMIFKKNGTFRHCDRRRYNQERTIQCLRGEGGVCNSKTRFRPIHSRVSTQAQNAMIRDDYFPISEWSIYSTVSLIRSLLLSRYHAMESKEDMDVCEVPNQEVPLQVVVLLSRNAAFRNPSWRCVQAVGVDLVYFGEKLPRPPPQKPQSCGPGNQKCDFNMGTLLTTTICGPQAPAQNFTQSGSISKISRPGLSQSRGRRHFELADGRSVRCAADVIASSLK